MNAPLRVRAASLTASAALIAALAISEGFTTNAVQPVPNDRWTIFGTAKSDTSADNTGTAAAARIRTAPAGTDIITGLTVGTSASDINLDSVSITAGQTVTINSATVTHA